MNPACENQLVETSAGRTFAFFFQPQSSYQPILVGTRYSLQTEQDQAS
jgi:hypothetical protein